MGVHVINPGLLYTTKESKIVSLKVKKPIAVANRCSAYHIGATMPGNIVGTTYRYQHVMKTECHSQQFVFANNYPTQSSESSNTNEIIISATIEYGNALTNGVQTTALMFNGSRTATIGLGGMVISDPILRDIPVGATFYTRTWVSTPSDAAQVVPQTITMSASGDGKGVGNLISGTGPLTAAPSEKGYGPAAIIGVPVNDNAIAFGLFGDSIVADDNGIGWPVTLTKNYGNIILSKSGATIDGLDYNSIHKYRLRFARFITHAIVNFGTNDFNGPVPFTYIESHLQVLWKLLQGMGIEVYHSTTMPRTTGTFTTIEGQTIYNTNSYNTKRLQFNQKLRDGVYPIKVLDVAPAVETGKDSGIWKSNYTNDGIHPLAVAQDAVVGSVSLGL